MKKYILLLIRTLFIFKEININLSKGALGSSVRKIDYSKPLTWEFSAFSQNGEDGILDVLLSRLLKSNKSFIEIGSANGVANSTAYLALIKRYTGLMIEGGKGNSLISKFIYRYFNQGVKSINSFVTLDNIDKILAKLPNKEPDVYSIDIDGNDYYIVEKTLERGFRPSIFIFEYNASYGPHNPITIPYKSKFNYTKEHPARLYYGVFNYGWVKFSRKDLDTLLLRWTQWV